MRYVLRVLLIIPIITMAILGCSSSGNRPTTPTITPTPPVNIDTEAGTLQVTSYDCVPDLARMISEINTTTRIARRQRPSSFGGSPLTGFEIHARTPESTRRRCDGDAACFERFGNRGRIHAWCDGSGVEHESAHALAWAVALPCWRTVYHDEVNFKC